jgi:ribosome-binding factor A
MSPDLRVAKVYISVYAPHRDPDDIFEYIENNNAAIRKQLAHKVQNQLRHVPELHMYKDDTAEYVNRLEQLFDQINKEREEKYGSEEEEDGQSDKE